MIGRCVERDVEERVSSMLCISGYNFGILITTFMIPAAHSQGYPCVYCNCYTQLQANYTPDATAYNVALCTKLTKVGPGIGIQVGGAHRALLWKALKSSLR